MRKSRLHAVLLVLALTLGLAGTAGAWGIYNSDTGHYYGLSTGIKNWVEAEAEAVSLGGHLVTINDAAEQSWLFTQMFTQFSGDYLWIGLHQTLGSSEPAGGWVWISGEPVTYTFWGETEPNNAGGVNEDCAMIRSDSKWVDVPKTVDFGTTGIIEVVPLPPAILLLGSGLAGLAAWRRRRV